MKSDMIELAIPASKIFVTGIPVSKRFNQTYDRKQVCKSFDLDPDKDVVLFFAGGEYGLGRSNTILTLKALERLFPDLQVIAISGKNKKCTINSIILYLERNPLQE
jgi:processive 1,2-diacylglycerol beta-glucosyltransferase